MYSTSIKFWPKSRPLHRWLRHYIQVRSGQNIKVGFESGFSWGSDPALSRGRCKSHPGSVSPRHYLANRTRVSFQSLGPPVDFLTRADRYMQISYFKLFKFDNFMRICKFLGPIIHRSSLSPSLPPSPLPLSLFPSIAKRRNSCEGRVLHHRYYNRYTVCPRSSDPFYVVTYYIKWVTNSWTYSIYSGF